MFNHIQTLSFKIVILACIVMYVITSCSKEGYRTDSGLAAKTTNLTTYDYLASNEYHYFDTVLLIIDHLGLKDSLNNSGTFFAPTDFAINRLMSDNKITSLDDFYKKINSKFLTQYMFSDTSLTLDNATTTAKIYENWAKINVGISKIASSYYVASSSLTYYSLQYIKINGVLDGSAGAPANDEADAILKCQTTGIKSASGTNLNVLVNNATLNLIGDTIPTEKNYSFNIDIVQSDNDYTSSTIQLDSTSIASFFGITTSQMSDFLKTNNDSLKYYNVETDSTLSDNYTADVPGFWLGSTGNVVVWGDDAYLYADLILDTYSIVVGQYPGHSKVGDVYKLSQALVYISPDNITYTAYISITVNMKSQ